MKINFFLLIALWLWSPLFASEITIKAVGDILLGRVPRPFSEVADNLKEADLTFGNLECALTTHKKSISSKSLVSIRAGKNFIFKAHPDEAFYLKEAGFDVLSLANNHSMDFCQTGLVETLKTLEKAGILAVGAGRDIFEAKEAKVIEVRGLKVAFLAYTCILPGYFQATSKTAGVNPRPRNLLEDIKKAKKLAPLVVVSFHWGKELSDYPLDYQPQLARKAIDSGALLVLGHHPHCLQPIERYKNGLIAYSLGNFVGLGRSLKSRRTIILEVKLNQEKVISFKKIPILIQGKKPTLKSQG